MSLRNSPRLVVGFVTLSLALAGLSCFDEPPPPPEPDLALSALGSPVALAESLTRLPALSSGWQ